MPFTSMEELVRPFVSVVSTRQAPKVAAPPPQVTPPAYIRWGGESEFTGIDSFRDKAEGNPGFHTQDDQKPKRTRLNYSESARVYQDYRVENPDDANAYVILRMATGMVLSGPNDEVAVFAMNPEPGPPGTVEGSGQTPDSPPDISEIE
jgi:hypothetical protein